MHVLVLAIDLVLLAVDTVRKDSIAALFLHPLLPRSWRPWTRSGSDEDPFWEYSRVLTLKPSKRSRYSANCLSNSWSPRLRTLPESIGCTSGQQCSCGTCSYSRSFRPWRCCSVVVVGVHLSSYLVDLTQLLLSMPLPLHSFSRCQRRLCRSPEEHRGWHPQRLPRYHAPRCRLAPESIPHNQRSSVKAQYRHYEGSAAGNPRRSLHMWRHRNGSGRANESDGSVLCR